MSRAIRVRPLLVALALPLVGLTACGGDDEQSPAVAAVCDDFTWDDSADLVSNEEALAAIVDEADPDASLGQVLSDADEECPDVLEPYWDAVDAEQDGGNQALGEDDVEDPAITRQLEARGVDEGMVLRLGALFDALRLGSTPAGPKGVGGDPLSYGKAQDVAVEAVAACDAVRSGDSDFAAEADRIVEVEASDGKLRSVATYLENVFCPQVD